MFDPATISAIRQIAVDKGLPSSGLLAVAEVESGGKAFASVDGRDEPLIRFEGHYFYRRTSGEARERAVNAGLASPKAGAVSNPNSQAARWQMLARAIEIDAQAAYESVSWGVGQVMGAHWKALGFGAVTELVTLCRRDVAGQVDLMARFIVHAGLAKALVAGDFASFARGYNGPAYRANEYDTKMLLAERRWRQKLSAMGGEPAPRPIDNTTPVLRRGDAGAPVKRLQALLKAKGRDIVDDGHFGPRTETAVKIFQEISGLKADGIVGARTWAALGG